MAMICEDISANSESEANTYVESCLSEKVKNDVGHFFSRKLSNRFAPVSQLVYESLEDCLGVGRGIGWNE